MAVFADDEAAHVFYAIPTIPRLRCDPSGAPLLIFLKYRSLPPGATDATGGGLLECQTELTFTEDQRRTLTTQLQQRLEAAGIGQSVELRAPVFVDGEAHLLTFQPKTGGLVEAEDGSTKPSLHDVMLASFDLRLSREGAALFWDQLRQSPSPLGIRYQLDFMARLPAGRLHAYVRGAGFQDHWTDIAALPPGPARAAALQEADLAGVEVLDWPSADASLTALKTQLEQLGWDMIDKALGGRLAGTAGGQGPPPPVAVPDLDVIVDSRSAIVWTLSPQGNLETKAGLANATGFHELDLSDPIFQHVRVETHCNVDFARGRIAAVTVTLRYGDQPTHDVVFTSNDGMDVWEVIAQPLLGRTYRYASKVQFAASSHTLDLPEQSSDSPILVVSIDSVGWLDCDIAGAVDWTRVDQIQVALYYEDAARGVPRQDDTLVLTASAPRQHYERAVWTVIDQPLHYQPTYVLVGGRRVTRSPAEHRGAFLALPDVYERMLAVRFTAPAGFDGIASHVVECRYDDGAGNVDRKTYALTATAPSNTWIVGLEPQATERFSYRVTSSYADGHSAQGDWLTGEGSQTRVVGDVPASLLKLLVVPDLVDFSTVRLVTVSLRHVPPSPAPSVEKQMVFQQAAKDPQQWMLPLTAGDSPTYEGMVRYFFADGTKRELALPPSSSPTLVLQPPLET